MKLPVLRIPRGRLAQGAVLILGWQLCRMAVLAGWVIVAARAFGAGGYGVYAGTAGLAAVVAGFAGLGMGYALYQQVAIDPRRFDAYWGKTLLAYGFTGVTLGLGVIALARLMFPDVGIGFVVLIALSEVMAYPFLAAAAHAFAAHERMGWSAALPAMGALVRLLALLAFLAFDDGRRIGDYLPFHVVASVLGAAAGLFAVRRILHPGRASASLSWSDLRQTLPFSLAWFTSASMGSWDKALVLRLAGAELSGLYAVAYRFASFVALPMDSLVMAVTPRLFRHGGMGGHDQGLTRYAFTSIVGFGLLACCAVWVVAPVLPWLLGSEFAPSADLVRGIILMIPFYGLRQLGGHVLITYGRRGARIAIDLCALALMTALAVALIPTRGIVGAVAMIVAAEAFLAAMTWIVAIPAIRSARRRGGDGAGD